MAKQWHYAQPERYELEIKIMRQLYPQMELYSTPESDKYWQGKLKTQRGNTYEIRIVYPPSFPYQPPKAYVIGLKVKPRENIYEDGHLYLPIFKEGIWIRRATAATMVLCVAKWLDCYEMWQETSVWPDLAAQMKSVLDYDGRISLLVESGQLRTEPGDLHSGKEERKKFDFTGELAVYDVTVARDKALEHAKEHLAKEISWLRGLPLVWEIEDAAFDEDDECYKLMVLCYPKGAEVETKALWEYHIDVAGKLLPGTPVLCHKWVVSPVGKEKGVGSVATMKDAVWYGGSAEDAAVGEKERRRLEAPAGIVDRVHFMVTGPQIVHPGASFVIDIWAHLEQKREEVIQRAREEYATGEISIKSKGPVQIVRGTVLAVTLKLQGLIVEDSEDTILWEGDIGNATFAIKVPYDATEGPRRGLATIHVDGLQIARIYFVIQVGRELSNVDRIRSKEERHRKAFASYANPDRDKVLLCIQGIQKAAPELDIFLDVLSLRSGQHWEQRLWKVIPRNDIFYLFWSDNARQSEWVEKEWRCALKTRGLDFIDPVPLVSPEEVPPPDELKAIHFNDWMLAFMRSKVSK